MSVNDPIGDMLTRIRNAQMRKHGRVVTPGSRLRTRVLDVLQAEGYIRGYTAASFDNGRSEITIELKYYEEQPVIRLIERISRPGRRVYAPARGLPVVANGLGVSIISTPQGVMPDHEARKKNLGGEVLCKVF